ncbi:MAG: GGDEF domain-containing protein [Candidatus Nanopelagicales bacterium]|jgi:GGDEF domain-containing protein
MRGLSPRHAPPLPFRVLAGLLLVGAVSGMLFVILPSDRPDLQRLDLIGAVAYTAMALVVWFGLPRIPHEWGLDLAIYVTSVSSFAAVGFTDILEGRLLTGYLLVLFATFAAYFLPLRRYVLALIIMSATYGVAMLPTSSSITVVYLVIIVLITGSTSGFVAVLVRKLRAQATTDALTGVLNRTGFALATRYLNRETPTTLALIDLDGFKAYNDTHGHVAGDRYLTDVARLLQNSLRRTDVLARFGGDEFVVVMPDCPSAAQCLERLGAAGRDHPWSAGATQWGPDEPFDEALQRADERLYRAKSRSH